MKAFHPAPLPFPLLHIDTTWKFRDMIRVPRPFVRREQARTDRSHTNPEGARARHQPVRSRQPEVHQRHEDPGALAGASSRYGFDAAFGGARRDEEKSRAKERVFSFRDAARQWDPKNQRPELWNLYNGRIDRGESIRVFPLSNWTELDVWQYIWLENIPIVPLYFAARRPVVERDGTLIMVDDDRMRLRPGEKPEMSEVRFRTLGCYPLTGAIESTATTLARDHREMLARRELRAPGPADRPRRRGLDGAEEARGVLLMARVTTEIEQDIEATWPSTSRRSSLRFVTVGSVDDGKSTLIGRLLHDIGGHLRRSARAPCRKRVDAQTGRRDRLLALHRRPERRARAGHHHRRRVPLLLDRRPRKFIIADTPGPRAVHAQHGDRRVDRRRRDHPDRRAPRRAPADRRHAYIASLLGHPARSSSP